MPGDDRDDHDDHDDHDALDRVPFAASAAPGPVGAYPMTSFAADEAGNEWRRGLRGRVEAWARRRGFVVDEAIAVKEVDGVVVTVARYDVSDALAVVRATARIPVEVSVTVEPRTAIHDLRNRFFSEPFRLDDPDMDRRWHVETRAPHAARALLDDACLLAIDELGGIAWCRVIYHHGRIEIRIDSDNLAGVHLTLGMRVALALGRRAPRSSAYR